jgi:ribosomal protein S18 acetylase RimI-like enzyme
MERLTVRATARNEAAAVADLVRRHNERWSDSPAGWLTAEFIDAVYDMPGMDPVNDIRSIELDGRFVAGLAVMHQEPFSEIIVYTYLDVLSDEDTTLVARAIIEQAALGAQPYADRAGPDVHPQLVFLNWVGEPFIGLAREAGFGYVRSNFVMRRSVSEAEPTPPVPEGVRLRPIDVEADATAVAEVIAAFEDHHGDQVYSEEQLRHFMLGPGARPDLSRIARDEQGPCAAVLCSIQPDGGNVDILATLRRARGRGIATCLLRTAFKALADEGCTVVRLNVDGENTTGALALYERAGMTRESEHQLWMRPITRR